MAHSLQDYLKSGDALSRLADHGQRLLLLQRRLEATIPEALRPHTRIANFRLGKLYIHANNSAVAAKIRQLGPRIASELSSGGAEINQIEVKVQAKNPGAFHPIPQRPDLPGETQKQGLTILSNNLPANSPIRRALERLVKTVKE